MNSGALAATWPRAKTIRRSARRAERPSGTRRHSDRIRPASIVEVQARHHMNAGLKFTQFVEAIVERTRGKTPGPIALFAGRHTSSTKVFEGIAKDLEGLRASVDDDRLPREGFDQ